MGGGEEPRRPGRARHRRAAGRDATSRAGCCCSPSSTACSPAAGSAAARPSASKAFIMARVLPEHRRRGVGSRARARARRARSRARPQRRQRVRRVARRARRSASQRSSGSRRSTTSSSRCVWSAPRPSPSCRRGSRSSRSPTAATSCSRRRGRSRSRATRTCRCPAPSRIRARAGCATRRRGPTARSSRFDGGELVGYAGMTDHANGDATAEHGLTVVRRDRRRRGIARALKQLAAALGLVDRGRRARHLDAEGQRGDAGAQREPRLRDALARPDDAGADAVSIRVEVVEEDEAGPRGVGCDQVPRRAGRSHHARAGRTRPRRRAAC